MPPIASPLQAVRARISHLLSPTPRVALLVDGDNIPGSHAPHLLAQARRHGRVVATHVYATGMHASKRWKDSGMALHTCRSSVSNAADFQMSMDAAAMATRNAADVFLIATNDSHGACAARWLQAAGKTVIALGDKHMGAALREATHHVVVLPKIVPDLPLPSTPARPYQKAGDIVIEVLRAQGGRAAMTTFGHMLRKQHSITSRHLGHKTWSRYFSAHPDTFTMHGPSDARIISLIQD